MSDQSAIRMLQAAIENVRENCTGDEYKTLLAACNAADKAAEDSASADSEPRSLKESADKARQEFAARRGSSK